MEKHQQTVVPPIIIQNQNNQHSSAPDKNNSPKGNDHKAAIWVALIGLIGVLGLPFVNYCLKVPPEGNTPNNACAHLKKQLQNETGELQQIITLLKAQPNNLKLEADRISHENNIQSINNQLKSNQCE